MDQIELAQTEFNNHRKEALRIRDMVDRLLDTMEYHQRQMDTWQQQLASLATEGTVVAPLGMRHLRLVPPLQERLPFPPPTAS